MKRFLNINADLLGASASTLCALHCMLFPLAAAVLPFFAASYTPEAHAGSAAGEACQQSCCASRPATESAAVALHEEQGAAGACCESAFDAWFHAGLLCISLPLALWSLSMGHACHRKKSGLALGLPGLAMLVLGLLAPDLAPGTRVAPVCNICGGLLLASAHLWNRRACACSSREIQAPILSRGEMEAA